MNGAGVGVAQVMGDGLTLAFREVLVFVHDDGVLDDLLGLLSTENVANLHALVLVLLVVLKESPEES